jgi:hypothetical protein
LIRQLESSALSKDTFTITIKDGNISTASAGAHEFWGAQWRIDDQVALIDDPDIKTWIPDSKVVFGIHDAPTGFISWQQRQDLIDFIEGGVCKAVPSSGVATGRTRC